MNARVAIGAVVVVLAVVIFFATREKPVDPEVAIRAALEASAKAASEKNLDGTIEILSEKFKGPNGIDRSGAKRIIFMQLRQGDWSRVFFARTEVQLSEDATKANVTTHAVLARGSAIEKLEDVLPTSATVYRFEFQFEREGKTYRIISGEYRPAQLLDLK
ncbi:MAG: hypothetical protein HY791_17435 [Deltaproteobacteria bacterium]|nr:hypothetical protein [Deltaproteobacteria bacterium]